MSLQSDLFDYEYNNWAIGVVSLEFVAIALLAWKKSGSFLVGVLTFIALAFLFFIPYVNKVIALGLVAFWAVIAYFLAKSFFEMPTTIGIVVLTVFFVSGIHFGATELADDLRS